MAVLLADVARYWLRWGSSRERLQYGLWRRQREVWQKRLLCTRCSPFECKHLSVYKVSFPPLFSKKPVKLLGFPHLCIRMKVVLRSCRLPCKTLKQSLQQTKPVWISFCSIASMHICCITFQPRVYNRRSACNFIGAHLFKAISASVRYQPIKFCIVLLYFVVLCISAVRKEPALLHCSKVVLGSFLSLFRFKSCFDCLETRNNGRVSKYSELPN